TVPRISVLRSVTAQAGAGPTAQLSPDDLTNLARPIPACAMAKRCVGRAIQTTTFGFIEAAAIGNIA
ncbi:MAG: hypothetical protein ACKO9A_05275, partial [Alphaproteobacteria bacterium]